jgi:hypothetical protein
MFVASSLPVLCYRPICYECFAPPRYLFITFLGIILRTSYCTHILDALKQAPTPLAFNSLEDARAPTMTRAVSTDHCSRCDRSRNTVPLALAQHSDFVRKAAVPDSFATFRAISTVVSLAPSLISHRPFPSPHIHISAPLRPTDSNIINMTATTPHPSNPTPLLPQLKSHPCAPPSSKSITS